MGIARFAKHLVDLCQGNNQPLVFGVVADEGGQAGSAEDGKDQFPRFVGVANDFQKNPGGVIVKKRGDHVIPGAQKRVA